jgi:hypothetical protein
MIVARLLLATDDELRSASVGNVDKPTDVGSADTGAAETGVGEHDKHSDTGSDGATGHERLSAAALVALLRRPLPYTSELRVWKALVALCNHVLENHPTTVAEDELAVASCTRTCHGYRSENTPSYAKREHPIVCLLRWRCCSCFPNN